MRVSKNTPFYFLTSVCKDRLPVFKTDAIKQIGAAAFDEARNSGQFRIFAYVLMPDHYHLITDSSKSISDTLRYLNGISARRIIQYLNDRGMTESLMKLKRDSGPNRHKFSLWDHHPNSFRIEYEAMLLQKAHYIHQNPVRAGLVEKATDYLYSSARYWDGSPLEHEPLKVDFDRIEWLQSRGR